jgi:glycosyltransferase involved in cell wall biosynthesis
MPCCRYHAVDPIFSGVFALKKSITVIIPSRTGPQQRQFLSRAVRSIQQQSVFDQYQFVILVGIDKGAEPEAELESELGLKFVESYASSQAAALNGAIRKVDSDFIAFLEDDDQWYPHYLGNAMRCLEMTSFVSSNQVEFDEHGDLLRINDFATPSGWMMPQATLSKVGEFSDEYRFHLDNEWLGRLSEAGIPRLHMVEATAPVRADLVRAVRPWLANVVTLSGGHCRLARHSQPVPLVRRLVHSGSGMARISKDEKLKAISTQEHQKMMVRFGRTPW